MPKGTDLATSPSDDKLGQQVRILTGIMAILLSLFTMMAHRTHKESLDLQKDTSSQWQIYQAKRIRDYQLELNKDLVSVLPLAEAKRKVLQDNYAEQHAVYQKELGQLKEDAVTTAAKSTIIQRKALNFELMVGVFEIALVMTSLYFIGNKKIFPLFGLIAGILGILVGIFGIML